MIYIENEIITIAKSGQSLKDVISEDPQYMLRISRLVSGRIIKYGNVISDAIEFTKEKFKDVMKNLGRGIKNGHITNLSLFDSDKKVMIENYFQVKNYSDSETGIEILIICPTSPGSSLIYRITNFESDIDESYDKIMNILKSWNIQDNFKRPYEEL